MACFATPSKIKSEKLPRQSKRAQSVNASAPILACKSTISQTKLQTFSFNLFCRCSCGTQRFLKKITSENCFSFFLYFLLACFFLETLECEHWAYTPATDTDTDTEAYTHDYNFHTIESLIIMWTCRHTKQQKIAYLYSQYTAVYLNIFAS